MTDGETRDEKYKRQTTENFALLGRFVQSFEQMVHWARAGSIMLLGKTPQHQQLLNRVFYSEALSAVPQWDIFRNLLTAIVVEMMPDLAEDQRKATLAILKQLDGDYKELAKRRNQLLHGTWYIGWANSEQTDFSAISVVKPKWKAAGHSDWSPLRDPEELSELTEKCDKVGEEIRLLWALFLMTGGPRVLENFTRANSRWVLRNTLTE